MLFREDVMFKRIIIVATVAIVMATAAFTQSADAAVCRLETASKKGFFRH